MDAGLNLYLGPVHIVVQVRLVDLLPTARTKLLRELHRVASTRRNQARSAVYQGHYFSNYLIDYPPRLEVSRFGFPQGSNRCLVSC
jgi:hypothetical protein